MRTKLIIILIIILCITFEMLRRKNKTIALCERQITDLQNTIIMLENDIPSIWEVQKSLQNLDNSRYNIGNSGVDGIPGPNTLNAWKNWSFDKMANFPEIINQKLRTDLNE